MFEKAFAAPLDIEIIARSAWNAGYTLVAEKFQRGRIFLGGDAAHLFTPAGGLGYNTAVEDAVNLGWKLARRAQGLGRPCAARQLRDRAAGDRAAQHDLRPRFCQLARTVRAAAGAGGRRPGRRGGAQAHRRPLQSSRPVRVQHSRASRSAAATTARRSSCPTARRRRPTPSTAISRPPARAAARRICGSATAARSTTRSASSSRCCSLAPSPPTRRRSAPPPRRMNMPLSVVAIASDEARDLYGADLALIRPDQIVAWRGNSTSGRRRRAAPRRRAPLNNC